MHTKNSESGQAIVLIVLAMIALLGFTALAVDGSMVYSDRRWAQNVSDASALAGGGAAAQNMELQGYLYHVNDPWGSGGSCPAPVNSAIAVGLPVGVARATENDYNLPNPLTEEAGGIDAECVWDGPLPYIDFTTVVKKTTDTAFAQLVFSGGLENTNTAVARVRPAIGIGWGRSIVALNPANCQGNQNGLIFNGLGGHNYLDIIQGGVWSNGCMNGPGNVDITITDGAAEYYYAGSQLEAEDFTFFGGGSLNQMTNTEYRMAVADYMPPVTPDCSDSSNRYTDHDFMELATRTEGLDPGLYCLTNGLSIGAHDVVTGDMVTIVILNGDVDIHGNATVMLSAPDHDDEEAGRDFGDAIKGLLFYVPSSNSGCGTNCMILNGDTNTVFTGSILAPAGEVVFLGNNGADLFGQIIGWDVEVGGSSESTVTYNPETEIILPTTLKVQK
jgi:hypothetical protein